MKNLQQIITDKVGIDKILHFVFGGWIACLASNWYIAILIGLSIGLLKEFFDRYVRKSTFDVYDLLATFLGSVATAMYLMLGG